MYAAQYMKYGYKIRNSLMDKEQYIYWDKIENRILFYNRKKTNSYYWMLMLEDLLADDWEIVKE